MIGGKVRKAGVLERADRREQMPFLPFIWESRGSNCALFELQQESFSDFDMIQQRSKTLYK